MAVAGCREAYGEETGGDILSISRKGNCLPIRKPSARDESAGILEEGVSGGEEMARGMQ